MPLTVFPLRSAEDRIVPPPLGVSNEAQGSLHDIGEPRMGIGMHHLFFLAPGEPEILLILLNHDVIYVSWQILQALNLSSIHKVNKN